jgi:hypothetical protein
MSGSARPSLLGAMVGRSTAGRTRVCPHCKSTILDSASICPACQRYLRYEQAAETRSVPELSPLRVSATVEHPEAGEPWEYSVVLSVRDENGAELSRQVVGVGALAPHERRTFNLAVEIFPTGTKKK